MAIDIALPVVLVAMVVLIAAIIVFLTVRGRQSHQRTGEASEVRRRRRGDEHR